MKYQGSHLRSLNRRTIHSHLFYSTKWKVLCRIVGPLLSFINPSFKAVAKKTLSILCLCLLASSAFAVVKYDEGRLQVIIKNEIEGDITLQLLQDNEDENTFYYLPQYPRLATKGEHFEFLCMKYVGGKEEDNGGLFHALVEFTLPPEILEKAEKELKKKVASGKIAGPVPMQQAIADGPDGMAGFKLVSSILNEGSGFTQSVVTSGHAPLLPGSRAAIAAKLNQNGATLLWESMQSPTSDISVAIEGYYEAAVKGYNAVITADVSTVYEHFSMVYNNQQGFTKQQLRDISDELVQEQLMKVEVFDRSAGLGIDNKDMEGILDLVTDKVVQLMFDAKTGWAQIPPRETAVESGQIKGRQKRGWIHKVFGGHDNPKYVSDNQFVMKKREDVRVNKFYLNLSKATTIKVPFFASGNLSGLYNTLGEDDHQYFRIVNLDDPDFQSRDVHFQVDGTFAESFKDILNFVSVSFRKTYEDEAHDNVTKDLIINKEDLEAGTDFKSVAYPRLGETDVEMWSKYEYKINWSLKGGNASISVPENEEEWLPSDQPIIALTPPFEKKIIEVDAERSFFKDSDFISASIRFFVILNGEALPQQSLTLRASDAENTNKITLYHDKEEPIAYQITWYSREGKTPEDPKVLKDTYLFVVPPEK